MKKEKSCGAIVINDKNQVLLVKHNIGHYGFPKGHVNSNETEIETAIREVITYKVGNNIKKDVIFFIARPTSYDIVPQLSEVSKAIWVEIDDVDTYLGFKNIIELWYNKIIKEIRSDKNE